MSQLVSHLRARCALVPLIVAATLALSACAGSAPATGSSTDATPGGDQTQPPSTFPAVGGAGAACLLITDEEAGAVLGIPITRNEESSSLPQAEGGGCIKGNERQTDVTKIAIVSYGWFHGPSADVAEFFNKASAIEDAQSVSGVGDRAVFSPGGGFLIVVRGDTVFTMQVSKSGTERGSQEEVVGLARLLLERVA